MRCSLKLGLVPPRSVDINRPRIDAIHCDVYRNALARTPMIAGCTKTLTDLHRRVVADSKRADHWRLFLWYSG